MKLTVQVQPSAHQSQIVEWLDADTIKIKVAAPAQEGRANQVLVDFLAKKLGIAKTTINLIRGHQSRIKLLDLPLPPDQVHAKLKIQIL